MPDGGHIRITGHVMDEGTLHQGQAVEIVVADTGIGIDASGLERIFGAFYRVEGPETPCALGSWA